MPPTTVLTPCPGHLAPTPTPQAILPDRFSVRDSRLKRYSPVTTLVPYSIETKKTTPGYCTYDPTHHRGDKDTVIGIAQSDIAGSRSCMCLFPCSVLYCSGTLRQMVDSSYCNKRCCVGSRVDLPYNTVFHFVPQPDGVVSFHFNLFFSSSPRYTVVCRTELPKCGTLLCDDSDNLSCIQARPATLGHQKQKPITLSPIAIGPLNPFKDDYDD